MGRGGGVTPTGAPHQRATPVEDQPSRASWAARAAVRADTHEARGKPGTAGPSRGSCLGRRGVSDAVGVEKRHEQRERRAHLERIVGNDCRGEGRGDTGGKAAQRCARGQAPPEAATGGRLALLLLTVPVAPWMPSAPTSHVAISVHGPITCLATWASSPLPLLLASSPASRCRLCYHPRRGRRRGQRNRGGARQSGPSGETRRLRHVCGQGKAAGSLEHEAEQELAVATFPCGGGGGGGGVGGGIIVRIDGVCADRNTPLPVNRCSRRCRSSRRRRRIARLTRTAATASGLATCA